MEEVNKRQPSLKEEVLGVALYISLKMMKRRNSDGYFDTAIFLAEEALSDNPPDYAKRFLDHF